MLLFVSKL